MIIRFQNYLSKVMSLREYKNICTSEKPVRRKRNRLGKLTLTQHSVLLRKSSGKANK